MRETTVQISTLLEKRCNEKLLMLRRVPKASRFLVPGRVSSVRSVVANALTAEPEQMLADTGAIFRYSDQAYCGLTDSIASCVYRRHWVPGQRSMYTLI